MVKTFNQVIIEGYVGNQPEFRVTARGTNVIKFVVATEDSIFNEKKIQWHNIVIASDVVIEAIKGKLKKGSRVRITGTLYVHKVGRGYLLKQNTEIIVDSGGLVEFVEIKSDISTSLYDD